MAEQNLNIDSNTIDNDIDGSKSSTPNKQNLGPNKSPTPKHDEKERERDDEMDDKVKDNVNTAYLEIKVDTMDDNDNNDNDVSSLKAQLFESYKQCDIDNNEMINFDQFSSVIHRFLPNTTDEKINEMFSTLDENGDGNISYIKFLEDTNFHTFLEYCGYFTYPENTKRSKSANNLNEVTAPQSTNFYVRNAHDLQIISDQKQVIKKLNSWINDEGKPAKQRVNELILENEKLMDGINKKGLEIETIKSELITVNEDKSKLQIDLEDSINDKKIFSEKLKDIKDDLNKTEERLQEYYEKDSKFSELEINDEALKKENNNLKIENAAILDRNIKFEEKNNLLQNELNERMEEIEGLNEKETNSNIKMNELNTDISALNDELNERNKEIDDLKQRLGLTGDSNTYRPITSSMQKTARLDIDHLSYLKTSTINITGRSYIDNDDITNRMNTLSINNNSTIRGFHEDMEDDDDDDREHTDLMATDLMAGFGGGGRGGTAASQSIAEQQHGLQAQIFEYQAKEIKWKQECDGLNIKLIQIKKQFDEQILVHELETKRMIETQKTTTTEDRNETQKVYNLKLKELLNEVRILQKELNEKNEKINDLNKRFNLKKDGPFTSSSMDDTVKMKDLKQIKTETLNVNDGGDIDVDKEINNTLVFCTESMREYNNDKDKDDDDDVDGQDMNKKMVFAMDTVKEYNNDRNKEVILCRDRVKEYNNNNNENTKIIENEANDGKWKKEKEDLKRDNDRLKQSLIEMNDKLIEMKKKCDEIEMEQKPKAISSISCDVVGVKFNENEKSALIDNKSRTRKLKKNCRNS